MARENFRKRRDLGKSKFPLPPPNLIIDYDAATTGEKTSEKKKSLYEKVGGHIGLKDNGGVKSTDTRFDWDRVK